jgi:hypothetical protein
MSGERVVYVGDGGSGVNVMLHVSRIGGLTVAVSENGHLTPIARRTILSDDGLFVRIPILEGIAAGTALASARCSRAHRLARGSCRRLSDDARPDRNRYALVVAPLQTSSHRALQNFAPDGKSGGHRTARRLGSNS